MVGCRDFSELESRSRMTMNSVNELRTTLPGSKCWKSSFLVNNELALLWRYGVNGGPGNVFIMFSEKERNQVIRKLGKRKLG